MKDDTPFVELSDSELARMFLDAMLVRPRHQQLLFLQRLFGAMETKAKVMLILALSRRNKF